MHHQPDISICISTYQRPRGLARLLDSLARLHMPDFTCELVITDNDATASARETVNAFSAPMPVRYVVEPEKNIARARNRCVQEAQGEWLAFIDDDETAAPHWLAELHRMIQNYPDAAAFFGPVEPEFAAAPRSRWLDETLYRRPRFATGTVIGYQYTRTGNALVQRSWFERFRFDPAYGRSGGSDVAFFHRIQQAGARFYWCDQAIVHEYVPVERMRPGWLLRRAFRGGQGFTRLHMPQMSRSGKFKTAAKSLIAAGVLLPAAVPALLLAPKTGLRLALRALVQIGHLSALAGARYEEYGERTRHADTPDILLVFNFGAHYRIPLFEYLARLYRIRIRFFSRGDEHYTDRRTGAHLGNFDGRYVRGFNLGRRIRINPGLLVELFFRPADVIIKCINGPVPLLASFVAARVRAIPFVLWTGIWHDLQTPFHRLFAPVVRMIYRHSDAIITYGDHVTAYLAGKGISKEKIFPAYQACDLKPFLKPVSEKDMTDLRTLLGIETRFVILYVGRFTEEKGLDTLFDAFEALDRDDVTLLLIGAAGKHNPLMLRAGMIPRTCIVPFVPNEELYRYYALADIFVLPSITTAAFREPWGFVVNEAMCQNCAIIVSDAVGAGQGGLLRDMVDSLIVPERQPDALAQALQWLLEDDELRQRLQKSAAERIRTWTIPFMARGFDAAIAHALEKHEPEHAAEVKYSKP